MYPNLRLEMIKANISIVSLAGRIGVSEKTHITDLAEIFHKFEDSVQM